MKIILLTEKSKVISVLGLKLWIAKSDTPNFHLSFKRKTIGGFYLGIQFSQKSISTGLENGFIK